MFPSKKSLRLGQWDGRRRSSRHAEPVLRRLGQPIGERQLEILEHEHLAYQDSLDPHDRWQRGIGLFLVFSLLTTLVVLYVNRFQTALAQSLPMIGGVCILVLGTIVFGLLLSP